MQEIKAIRREIRNAISRRDSANKIQFRVEGRERVLLGIYNLSDILIDLVLRDEGTTRERER